MNKITIIALFLIVLVLITGCTIEPTGDEGEGSRELDMAENSELEEDIDTSELDDIDVDESLL